MAQQSPLPILRDVRSIRQFRTSMHGPVSLVPTMGLLHQGHLSLVRLAAEQTQFILVSIYANPSQLTTPEEAGFYPSTLKSDVDLLLALNEQLRHKGSGTVQAIFAPTDQEMYPCSPPDSSPHGVGSFVNILPLTRILEGADRPSHFVGVATVCLKLFNAAKPDKVYFGQKDFQQTVLVKRLVQDFLLNIDVVVGETIREDDGLAMSSRNVFLGTRRRTVATVIHRALQAAQEVYINGQVDRDELLSTCKRVVEEEQTKQRQLPKPQRTNLEIIYFGLADPVSLEATDKVNVDRGAVICGAVQLLPNEDILDEDGPGGQDSNGSVRLIDSVLLEPRKTGQRP
ncbi:MAG: hypothetical protein Q9166_004038 [cf. Caloplaca sp. 2 TL-2023]